MLRSRDSRVLQCKDKNKFEINKEILLLLFISYSKLTFLALSLTFFINLNSFLIQFNNDNPLLS